MGNASENIPNSLRIARRQLDEIPNVKILDDWIWHGKLSLWALTCELTLFEYIENPYIPQTTNWYVTVSSQYPLGNISFFPSKAGGITHTFQHQLNNSKSNDGLPWRFGSICLDLNVKVLGRFFSESEPFSAEDRLLWYVQRAINWLRAASQGKFTQPDELFELPDFSPSNDLTVAFSENDASFKFWMSSKDRVGVINLAKIEDTTIYAVTRFMNYSGKVILSPVWGNVVDETKNNGFKGLWIRLDTIPTLEPWQPPACIGELANLIGMQGLDFFDLIKHTLPQIRDGLGHFLLVGFPIPSKYGREPIRMHWQAILLPILSFGSKTMKGFRPDETGYFMRDRTQILTDKLNLDWVQSENWNPEQISARGRLPNSLSSKEILIIGCGAVGAIVAELLIRGNATHLTLIDGEDLEVGNLVRHTLELKDIKKSKAERLADRLNSINPNANVKFLNKKFPFEFQSDINICKKCNLIIDCSGNDGVLFALNEFPWDTEKTIFSISVNYGATKSFLFAYRGHKFPTSKFAEKIKPHLDDLSGIDEIPVDGIGCWHPVFPGRSDDIWLLISATFKELVSSIDKPADLETTKFTIFEQILENGCFSGLRKIA